MLPTSRRLSGTRARWMALGLAAVVLAGGLAVALSQPNLSNVALATMLPSSGPSGSAGATATTNPTFLPSETPRTSPTPSESPAAGCPSPDNPTWSVARRWDEALLNAIRRSLPNPPVHARNLFHTSVAMWDAWAAYDPTARGYFVTQKLTATDVEAARAEAMSYAAFRVLKARFKTAVGGGESLYEFKEIMRALCYPIAQTSVEGNSPSALGNRIAAKILRRGLKDGSNEAGGYANPDYKPVNAPLVLAKGGNVMVDPNRWQPLKMAVAVSQNGISSTNLQTAVGTQWGHVAGFGILDPDGDGVAIDPGPQPRLGDALTDTVLKDQLVELIRDSAMLDPKAGRTIDISPGARGGNDLGSNEGKGHPINPATGQPYAAEVVNLADYLRVAAQFWADGPASETPPGHWNVIANDVGDELEAAAELRIGGAGPAVNRLEWDVKLYLGLNGAVHNAAIAAWGLKGRYDSSRPISLIRYMGGLGQSSDPSRPSYDPEGLPLVPGLIELITPQSAAEGKRHYRLRNHIGEVAVLAWGGYPDEPWHQVAGAQWQLATRWKTYQLPTFVTPAFAGYISGHSTFSRAAAEVMTAFTGNEYFPGGSSSYTLERGSLTFEFGPTKDLRLEWATYYDAADQAGQSRLYGGIHIQADDFTGRIIGAACGKSAWTLASAYYAGTVPDWTRGCVE
jgi:Domain of unknown function (DUF6851)